MLWAKLDMRILQRLALKEYYGIPRGHSLSIYGQKENFTVYFSGKRRSLLHWNTAQRSFFPLQSFSRKSKEQLARKARVNTERAYRILRMSPGHLACVASVSVRFKRKKRGTRVKDHAKSGASKRAGRGWGRKEGNACRQTPGFWKPPTWSVTPEFANRHLMLSSTVIIDQ